jgi:inhibitor of KinA
MYQLPDYKISSLGDSALIIDFGNIISRPVNDAVVSIFKKIQRTPLKGMLEVVPAYGSLAIYYDVLKLRGKITAEQTVFQFMKNKIITLLQEENEPFLNIDKREISIPVCYEKEFATDLEWMSSQLKIPAEEIIQLHTSKPYHVFMLGFLPGFAYMGEVDEKIAFPRKPLPVQVAAGSVGIAGNQTGVYPLISPGGWHIIGRTPVNMFKAPPKPAAVGRVFEDSESRNFFEPPTLLKAGDNVQFYSINKDEFENIKSGHS